MRTVEEQVAHESLATLLDSVAAGDEVTITRNGLPLARLQRTEDGVRQQHSQRRFNYDDVRAAGQRIRERAKTLPSDLTLEELLIWRDEGKR